MGQLSAKLSIWIDEFVDKSGPIIAETSPNNRQNRAVRPLPASGFMPAGIDERPPIRAPSAERVLQ
jgi:hypothetical protein